MPPIHQLPGFEKIQPGASRSVNLDGMVLSMTFPRYHMIVEALRDFIIIKSPAIWVRPESEDDGILCLIDVQALLKGYDLDTYEANIREAIEHDVEVEHLSIDDRLYVALSRTEENWTGHLLIRINLKD